MLRPFFRMLLAQFKRWHHWLVVLPVGVEEGQSTRGDVDSEVRTVAAITSLSA